MIISLLFYVHILVYLLGYGFWNKLINLSTKLGFRSINRDAQNWNRVIWKILHRFSLLFSIHISVHILVYLLEYGFWNKLINLSTKLGFCPNPIYHIIETRKIGTVPEHLNSRESAKECDCESQKRVMGQFCN